MTLDLSKKIRHYRKLKGITQEVLARESESTKDYIGLVERGIVRNIGVERLARIAKALGIHIKDLFDDPKAA